MASRPTRTHKLFIGRLLTAKLAASAFHENSRCDFLPPKNFEPLQVVAIDAAATSKWKEFEAGCGTFDRVWVQGTVLACDDGVFVIDDATGSILVRARHLPFELRAGI